MLLRRVIDAELSEVVDLVNVAFRKGSARGWAVEFRVVEGPRIRLEGLRADIAAKPNALQMVWRDEADTAGIVGSVWMGAGARRRLVSGAAMREMPDAQTKQLG